MNILLINHYAGSPKMGMEFRPYYLAKEWVSYGHKVTIASGDYSHLRKNNPVVKEDFEKESIDGIDYLWFKTGAYAGNGVARAKTMLRFCHKLSSYRSKIIKDCNPDVVISSSTYPIDSYPAKKIARRCGAKYIHEVHDMWPSTLYEIGGMSRANPFVVMMQIGENHAYKHCDELVSLLSDAKPYMVKHGLAPEKFHCLRNGVVEAEWKNPEDIPVAHKEALERLQKDGKFIIGYFGGHALSNDIDLIVNTADRMKTDKSAHFVLVGDGVEKERIVKDVKERGLQNITFLGSISKLSVPTLLSYFDMSIITALDSPLYRFGTCMNKMFDSMMAGLPIVMSVSAPSLPIVEADCGIAVSGHDIDKVKDAIGKIKALSVKERKEMGERGHDMIMEEYTYCKIAKEFEKLFY